MEQLYSFLENIINLPTPSGYEGMSSQGIMDACLDFCDGFFTEAAITKSGSVVLCRKCGKQDAFRFCLDAHMDTVGFSIAKICGGGYLKMTNLGGIDTNLLPSCEVLILADGGYIPAVFSSVPPHLSLSNKLPEIGELLVDTGLSRAELEKRVDIGTPAIFMPHFTRLIGDRFSSVHLDDKICIAAIMQAMKTLDRQRIENTDIYVCLSSGEERGGSGSYHIHTEINPDALIVLDVNFAKEKGSVEGEYGQLGGGAMVSFSAVTSRKLTQLIVDSAKDGELQIIDELSYTGTNADIAAKQGLGIAAAVMSVPIKYMHSSVETADMKDVISASNIIKNTLYSYDKNRVCAPVYYKGGENNG